jgi:spore coat-associated protein N
MKKKIAMLAIGAMLAVALVGGGVYAYFNDTENSSGNQFSAGSLDLVLGGTGSASMSFANVAPGSVGVATMNVANQGTIGGTVTMTAANMTDDEGATWEPETNTVAPGDLSAKVDIVVFVDINHDGAYNAGDSTRWTGKLSALPIALVSCGSLAGSASMDIGIYYSVDPLVGNDIMGDIVTFDLVFTLTQG